MDAIIEVIGDWIGLDVPLIASWALVVFAVLRIVSKLVAVGFQITSGTPEAEMASKASRFFLRLVKIIDKISLGTAKEERAIATLTSIADGVDDTYDERKAKDKKAKAKDDED